MTARIEPLRRVPPAARAGFTHPALLDVWASAEFAVQIYAASHGTTRITVSRRAHGAGRRSDAIGWDELMAIKHYCGYGDRWAVEIYPSDADRADDSAMHHLWVLPFAPPYAWTRSNPRTPR